MPFAPKNGGRGHQPPSPAAPPGNLFCRTMLPFITYLITVSFSRLTDFLYPSIRCPLFATRVVLVRKMQPKLLFNPMCSAFPGTAVVV